MAGNGELANLFDWPSVAGIAPGASSKGLSSRGAGGGPGGQVAQVPADQGLRPAGVQESRQTLSPHCPLTDERTQTPQRSDLRMPLKVRLMSRQHLSGAGSRLDHRMRQR